MEATDRHRHAAAARFDGGSMDCGNGLLLHLRRSLDPLLPGQLLEILSTESSVEEDLPAWCNLTGNELLSWTRNGPERSFLIAKGRFVPGADQGASTTGAATPSAARSSAKVKPTVASPESLPPPVAAPAIEALSVMGIGSWPRPAWLVRALHDYLEGRLPEEEFQTTADDAVRLAVASQIRAGVDVVTDGEQRRDSYANFIGSRLDNCQLIPLVDLLPLVEDPEKLKKEFEALDVPATEVRHPAVYGALSRSRPIALHEFAFARTLTDRPIKVALPGPYLLSRILWMECVSDQQYDSREDIAVDIVRVLREEIAFLLAAGVALVQLDEPVLTEVVFGGPKNRRSFMCGAMS
jgi:5-methyltetrahydropteroyltriglutamate--homocysteine methyltransferase